MENPLDRFAEWLARANALDRAVLPEPTAFSLGTVSPAGRPSVRMLLLKGVTDSGFVFYTNLDSRKSSELSATGVAAMCFHWAPLELQVRVEGTVTSVSDADADAYFATRSRDSQLGAWASRQSREMESEGDLERRFQEMEKRFAGAAVPRPAHWSGYLLTPDRIEFWQGRAFRLHRRELFVRDGSTWRATLLYP